MTNNERKEHLWIPDEEVIRLDKTLTARTTPRNISFSEHGQKLSHSLQAVKEIIDSVQDDNSLSDSDLMIFKIVPLRSQWSYTRWARKTTRTR